MTRRARSSSSRAPACRRRWRAGSRGPTGPCARTPFASSSSRPPTTRPHDRLLPRLLPLPAPARRRGARRRRPAGHRARHADARGHRPLPPLVRPAFGGPRDVRVRRLEARPRRVRRGRRAGGHGARPARARVRVPAGRRRLDEPPRARRRSEVRAVPPDARARRRRHDAVRRGLDAPLAPERRAARDAPPRRQGARVPGDRLRPPQGEGEVRVHPPVDADPPRRAPYGSRHYWEVGALDPGAGYGWMGRYLDRVGDPDNPLQGLSLDSSLAPPLAAARVPVAAVDDPADYSFWVPGVGDPVEQPMLHAIGSLGQLPAPDAAVKQARAVAGRVDKLRPQLAPLGNDGKPTYTSPVTYPGGEFGKRLAALAAMVASGLPLRCVAITAPGSYDTHSNQVDSLTTGLQQTCDGLLAFQRDLEARGIADRVLLKGWSEFGRRPEENGSGTDHGAAGCAFLIGTRAKGQMVGQFPGLATLDAQQNLRSTADFRALYCGLLEQWLGHDAADVIPGASGFTRPLLLKS